jgi:predicted DNA-binding transcriptional regulator AlpA
MSLAIRNTLPEMPAKLRLVGLTEVAQLLAVSKRTASRYTARSDFPAPAAELAMGPIWLAEDVEAWVRTTEIPRGRPSTSQSR